MADQTIRCPQCNAAIPLTEVISSQVREAKKSLEQELAQRLAVERERIAKETRTQWEQQSAVELRDLKQQIDEKNRKLADAQAQELELRRQRRELEDRQKAFELEIARKMDGERRRIGEEVAKKAAEEHHLKELEKEKQIMDLRRQIEELKRVAEQGSQQTQGEVMELELETLLRARFPFDVIEPVSKGVRGADVLQRVRTKTGQTCGTIIWESKHTKAWSDGWIDKLKDDQRAVKAEAAVLLSTALPKDVPHFAYLEGIWVTNHACFVSLATALRMSLIQIAAARAATEGRQEKMQAVYDYLAGVEFKQRIEAIVETFVAMREQLDQEKRALNKIWLVREKQLERVTDGMVGLHGDLKGIIGATLPPIKALELDPEFEAADPSLPPPGGDRRRASADQLF